MDEIINLIESGKPEEANVKLDEILQINEFDIHAMSLKALVLTKLENYQDAIVIYSSLINLIPNDADNFASRGLAYHFSGDLGSALADFERAIELDPENGYRYSSRAFIRDYHGDSEGAIEDYKKAIELDPEDAVSLNNIGVIQEKLGRLKDAKKNFDKSDDVMGIDLHSIQLPHTPQVDIEMPEHVQKKKKNIGVGYFLSTLKSLFTSPDERRNFYRFLFKK